MSREYVGLPSAGPLYDYKMNDVVPGLRCRHEIVSICLPLYQRKFSQKPPANFSSGFIDQHYVKCPYLNSCKGSGDFMIGLVQSRFVPGVGDKAIFPDF